MALILKERLLDYDKEELILDENQENVLRNNNEAKPFLKISFATLFKVGITSKYGRTIAILITFVVTLYQTFKDAVDTFELDETQVDSAFEQSLGIVSIIILFVGLLALILFVNIIRTFIKHFDFEMKKQRNSLLVTSGLFAKRNTLLNPKKYRLLPSAKISSKRNSNFRHEHETGFQYRSERRSEKAMPLKFQVVIL